MDIYSLNRFVEAQDYIYETALAEITNGEKRTHWMWFIFPELRGLGQSQTAYTYGIADVVEARAYLLHPLLSKRLAACCEALLRQENDDPEYIFGDTDAMKLQSSMTLFALVSDEESIYHRVLQRFFNGTMDQKTIELASGHFLKDQLHEV